MAMKTVDAAILFTVGPLVDSTDFKTLKTGIAYNAAGMDVSFYQEEADGTATKTALTLTTSGTQDWVELGDGYYTVEITAAQNNKKCSAWVGGVVTGALPFESGRFDMVPANVVDSLIKGTDALQVHTNEITNNLITSSTIATDAIGAAQIAASAIGSSELASGAITAAKFAAGAIDSTAIAASAIGASQIATGAITSAKFAAGAIDAAAIATGAIDADALATDAATEIRSLASGTSDSGTTTTMVDAARTEADTDYWKGCWIAFTSGTIAGQVRLITGFNAGTDTITFAPATTQAVGTQTYEILPAAAVTLADGSITAAVIATDAIDADAIADNAIDAGAIASGAITSAKFAAGAITATVIATDAIDADAMADGAITAATFAASAIDATAIASGAITSAKFAAGAIDATAIAADAIGSSELAATAATEIAAAVWDEAASGHVASGTFGQRIAIIRANTAQAGASTTITLDASASATDDFYNNTILHITGGTGAGQARIIEDYVGATKVATVAAWATNPDNTSVFVIHPFGAIPGATAPSAAAIADAVWDEATSGHTTSGTFGEQLKTDVDAILDDTGTSGVVLATGSITAAVIATDAIDADAIADNAINAGAIATGAITSAKFAAGAIDAAAIATDAIDADAMADGAITAATFAAGAITATVIATDAIDDDAIATGAIASTAFAAGAITASAIAADAIGASELAADAVAEIADGVWDELTSGHTTSGSFGLLTTDHSKYIIGDLGVSTGDVLRASFAVVSADGTIVDATACTVNVYEHDGTTAIANGSWTTGPTEAADNFWYMTKTTASGVLTSGQAYHVKVVFTVSASPVTRWFTFNALS